VVILQSRVAPAPESLAWLFDLLFSGAPTVTWAPARALPAGFTRADQFAVLPGRSDRTFTVSLASRPGAASALTSYNALRSGRTRMVRQVLGLGLRTGLAQLILRNKVDIGVAAAAAPAQLSDSLLGRHLQHVFDAGPVTVAIGASGGPYRKPVLQVFSASGTPLGYVKVGWNDWTRQAVRREATALRTCAARPMRLGVPEVIGLTTWRDLDLLVTAPLPPGIRGVGDGFQPDAGLLLEISELSPAHHGELAGSPWWLGIRSRIRSAVTDPGSRAALMRATERLEHGHGRATMRFGAWHGDLVPWNLARLAGRLYAWDWETSTPDAPLGLDALHFHFQMAFVARLRPLEHAVTTAARKARPVLAGLGLTQDATDLLPALHLIELAVRHEEARASSGAVDDRFFPAVMRLIERTPAPPGAPDSPRRPG
jgi:hypothetical protein